MIVKSILDTDLYKFSMSNAYFQLFPLAEGTFTFNDRGKEIYTKEFLKELWNALDNLGKLSLNEEEFQWVIKEIPYIPISYWEWLRTFRFDPTKIVASLSAEGHLQLCVTDKIWKATLYEVPLLEIISELRNKKYSLKEDKTIERLQEKINLSEIHKLPFSEFGSRRRFSGDLHRKIVSEIKKNSNYCVGTSNVMLAKEFSMTPTGTQGHEYFMFHSGVFGYKRANYLGLENWINVYDGSLGTALVDTFTTSSFLRTLTKKQAKLLDGFRIDSGDEYTIGKMIIKRLKELGVDPSTKLLVFSNALDFPKYQKIYEYFSGITKVSAGIGTNLTCDPVVLEDYKPANIVMKLSKCRMSDKDPWENVIKISDDLGKHMGDEIEFKIAFHELHL